MDAERCGTCHYYLLGECHFEPAKLFWLPDEVKFQAMHPPTTASDWCGCWKPKERKAEGEELVEGKVHSIGIGEGATGTDEVEGAGA